jgi:alpha-tubulin suppressor-like RCC1 family protein
MSKLIFVDNSLSINGKKIIQISSGLDHSLFLVETGQVYSCGYNYYGQLGRIVANGSPTATNLGMIPNLSDIIQISAGNSCSLFLNSSNQVYSCGRNIYGGLGRIVADGSPTKVNLGIISSLSNITQISAGYLHSLFLNSSGQVYSCGYNYYGGLGRNVANGNYSSNLGLISDLSNITQIFAGRYSSSFLNSSGQVYNCGYNNYGQLGRIIDSGSPTSVNLGMIPDLSDIIQISAGQYYSLFLNSSNQVYSYGENNYGQLGRVVATGSPTSVNLGIISDLSDITQISGGFNHSLFLNSSKQVYSCGNNTNGELGRIVANGSPTSVNLGIIPDLSNITQISTGYNYLLFLNSSNQIYSCGYNNRGQLGRNVDTGSPTATNLGLIPENSFD